MRIILNWLIYAAAILVSAYLLPGVAVADLVTALILAVVLGAVNTFLRPILIFLTLPVTIVTLGLFVLVINAALVMLAAYIVPGFTVAGFWWALAFSLVLSIVSWVLGKFGKEREEED